MSKKTLRIIKLTAAVLAVILVLSLVVLLLANLGGAAFLSWIASVMDPGDSSEIIPRDSSTEIGLTANSGNTPFDFSLISDMASSYDMTVTRFAVIDNIDAMNGLIAACRALADSGGVVPNADRLADIYDKEYFDLGKRVIYSVFRNPNCSDRFVSYVSLSDDESDGSNTMTVNVMLANPYNTMFAETVATCVTVAPLDKYLAQYLGRANIVSARVRPTDNAQTDGRRVSYGTAGAGVSVPTAMWWFTTITTDVETNQVVTADGMGAEYFFRYGNERGRLDIPIVKYMPDADFIPSGTDTLDGKFVIYDCDFRQLGQLGDIDIDKLAEGLYYFTNDINYSATRENETTEGCDQCIVGVYVEK